MKKKKKHKKKEVVAVTILNYKAYGIGLIVL